MAKRHARSLALAVIASGASVVLGCAVPASAAPVASTTLTAITAVSCPSTTHCWAGAYDAKGSAIIETADGGVRWSVDHAATRFSDISSIDCASVTHCVAIGDTGEGSGASFLETTDAGKVWHTRAAPKSLAIAEALSCASGSDCWAIGLAGNRVDAAVARTTDGGAVWTPESVPKLETAMSSPFGISCTSSTHCLATGEAALTTTNGGKTWTRHAVPGGVPLGPVTCPSAADCYAIFDVTSAIPSHEQTYLYTSANGGLTWKDALADPRHVAGLGAISCPWRSTCVAAGGGYTPRGSGTDSLYGVSERSSTSGRIWTKTTVATAQYLFADSCVPRTRDCVAGGEDGARAVILKSSNDGATWTSEPLPPA
jgi:photosystem II stability/assembly factor-like uncharacterized protein